MERKNQLILFAMLVFLVVINFIKNTAVVNNNFITIVFLLGMIFICATFVVIKMKQRADKKHAELAQLQTKDTAEDAAATTEAVVAKEAEAAVAASESEDKDEE